MIFIKVKSTFCLVFYENKLILTYQYKKKLMLVESSFQTFNVVNTHIFLQKLGLLGEYKKDILDY